MFKFLLTALLFLLPAVSFAAADAPATVSKEDYEMMNKYYDQAFAYFNARDYAKAIEDWNAVLAIDAEQITAKKMIEEARRKLEDSNKEPWLEIQGLIGKGKYREALTKLRELLSQDNANSKYRKLNYKLEKAADIVPVLPPKSKSWHVAGLGLRAFLSEKEDSRLAYDALRYAKELGGKDEKFARLLSIFETEHNDLVEQDSIPPDISILEFKKSEALHSIYEGKYHLAVKMLSSVLAIEPNDVTALKRAGSAYYQLKNKKMAKSSWTRALKIAPEDEQLKKYLALLAEGKEIPTRQETTETPAEE